MSVAAAPMRRAVPFACLALLALAGPAHAQSYPSGPVTIVVPLAAGSGMDSIVRLFGEQLAPALGKPVINSNQAVIWASLARLREKLAPLPAMEALGSLMRRSP